MEIKGEVKEIIYQNEINSYTVAEFETQEEEIMVVGYLPFINVRRYFTFDGENGYSSRIWRTV
ncbi:MAG: hypothetical protein ACLS95_03795 [Clostridia bacterium]